MYKFATARISHLPFLVLAWAGSAWTPLAAEQPGPADQPQTEQARPEVAEAKSDMPASRGEAAKSAPEPPAHVKLLKEARKINGLVTLYQKNNRLFAELKPDHYQSDFIVLIAIARGIGRNPLYGGMTWGSGDDWVWQFRKVDKRIHIIRKNVRFRAKEGTPEATAIKYAYTDSVLFSLPLAAEGPGGGDLVDLTPVFMSDLPQIARVLPGFSFASSKSTWAAVKGFKDNLELEVAATYASSGAMNLDSVADSRGVTINVHYSISKLKNTGYKPRLADDRVGYFLTVLKDYSKQGQPDRFVRYINRWDLQKADPAVDITPPKRPIVFWMENTIPFRYRATIRAGILEWNRAFEKAGFANAIEVRQQPDNADWDAEDINYNTFRWITSSAGFAMGPSRVNPYNGQILDADIIFDADFLQHWKREFETFTPQGIAALTGGALDLESYDRELGGVQRVDLHFQRCFRQQLSARQFALGATALSMHMDPKVVAEQQEKMILQGLKGTVMHEVGHTLGLRHNFKGSAMLPLADLNDAGKTNGSGMLSSVMDYDPVNIVTKDEKQGDYFTSTIGPYDVWAIEYGYQTLSGGTTGEAEELAKIASRSGRPELAYATDEDTRGIDPDPLSNRFDLGKDPLEYAQRQSRLVAELLPGVVDRMTGEGDDFTQARRAFNVLLSTQGQAMFFVARFVGGLELSRSHKGDEQAPPPVRVVSAERQRQALELLEKFVFTEQPLQVPPETYNFLASSRWLHWGAAPATRPDYPVHEIIMMWQSRMLDKLLSPLTLTRLQDSELKVAADEDCFTNAELMQRLTDIVFADIDALTEGPYTNRQPAINSLRRNLQREYMKRISAIALGQGRVPEDCQSIAYLQLTNLAERIEKQLQREIDLDAYTEAHLRETGARIQKVLQSRLTQFSP